MLTGSYSRMNTSATDDRKFQRFKGEKETNLTVKRRWFDNVETLKERRENIFALLERVDSPPSSLPSGRNGR